MSILGALSLPYIAVNQDNARDIKKIFIDFTAVNHSPELLENKVTVKIESMMSTLKGIAHISSTSSQNAGRIALDLDDHTHLDWSKYEAALLLRQNRHLMPKVFNYEVSSLADFDQQKPILIYDYYGEPDGVKAKRYVETQLRKILANIDGIASLNFRGPKERCFMINYDPGLMQKLDVRAEEIQIGLESILQYNELGKVKLDNESKRNCYMVVYNQDINVRTLQSIALKKTGGRIVRLSDVSRIEITNPVPDAHHRINGFQSIQIQVNLKKKTNYLALSSQIIRLVKSDFRARNGGMLVLTENLCVSLKKEISAVALRFGLTLLILFALLLLLNRRIRYIFLLTAVCLSSLLITALFVFLMKAQASLLSIGLLAIVTGITVDNTIIVMDHFSRQKNYWVLRAVAGSILNMIGVTLIIYFSNIINQSDVHETVLLIILNLLTSLITVAIFVPALTKVFPLNKHLFMDFSLVNANFDQGKAIYMKIIQFLGTRKKLLIMLILLAFGLPTYLLPDKDEYAGVSQSFYSQTIGRDHVRLWLNRLLGGISYRAFENNIALQKSIDLSRTKIEINFSMPYGGSVSQLDSAVRNFESYIRQYTEVSDYTSDIFDQQHATIAIRFRNQFNRGKFPMIFKEDLENKATNTGLIEFEIHGIGEGFNNKLDGIKVESAILLTGYNYITLNNYAVEIVDSLKKMDRIEEVFIGSKSKVFSEHQFAGYMLELEKNSKLVAKGISPRRINNLMATAANNSYQFSNSSDSSAPLSIIVGPRDLVKSEWQGFNNPINIDTTTFLRPSDFLTRKPVNVLNTIDRRDQQYQLAIGYNYIGDPETHSSIINNLLKRMKNKIRLGYDIEKFKTQQWNEKTSELAQIVVLSIIVVFFASGILLNNFRQPMAVFPVIVLSFLGALVMPVSMGFKFQEGSFAALIFLACTTVNASLYIINEYNSFAMKSLLSSSDAYVAALKSKILPITFSVVSLSLGLLPFLILPDDGFWFSFSVSTISGLAFSLFGYVFLLPALIIKLPKSK
jgi:multidrug efflux pump subunit AcrB